MEKKRTKIVLELPEDNRQFPHQQCQDPGINERFRALHEKLVNQVIAFCVENNIIIDEFNLNADMLEYSIRYGSWQGCTDSSLVFDKLSEEYKDILAFRKRVSNEEFEKIKSSQEPFLYSI
jgi:hypothetical protein